VLSVLFDDFQVYNAVVTGRFWVSLIGKAVSVFSPDAVCRMLLRAISGAKHQTILAGYFRTLYQYCILWSRLYFLVPTILM